MANNYFDALTGIANAITNLGLVLGSTTVPVNIRKLPKREENLDPATQVLVVPSEKPEDVKQWAYPNQVNTIYTCEIVVVTPNDGDQTSNLLTYFAWRSAIRLLFQGPPLANVIGCWYTKIVPGKPLDREKIAQNYDYLVLNVEVWCVERRHT